MDKPIIGTNKIFIPDDYGSNWYLAAVRNAGFEHDIVYATEKHLAQAGYVKQRTNVTYALQYRWCCRGEPLTYATISLKATTREEALLEAKEKWNKLLANPGYISWYKCSYYEPTLVERQPIEDVKQHS